MDPNVTGLPEIRGRHWIVTELAPGRFVVELSGDDGWAAEQFSAITVEGFEHGLWWAANLIVESLDE